MEPMRERVWRPGWPCSVLGALHQHRRGGGDPTFRIDENGTAWRGIRTPDGPTTLRVRARAGLGDVEAQAWGTGADWVLDSSRAARCRRRLVGLRARHPVLAEVLRHHPNLRLGRSGLVMEALVPAIIEQKVTGKEAFGGFRALVHRFGERAPGPGEPRKLWVQPSPDTLRTIPSWEWLRLHIDPNRSRTVVTVAKVAASLERTSTVSHDEADRRLRSLPGVGAWTSAEVRQRAFGDPDAVSFGDYHVAKDVGWALTGTPFDDAQLEEFLEPWRPQRGRVPTLVAVGGLRRPRHGPRMSLPTHLPSG